MVVFGVVYAAGAGSDRDGVRLDLGLRGCPGAPRRGRVGVPGP